MKYPTTNIVYSGLQDNGGPTITILDDKKNKWIIWRNDYENKEQQSEAYAGIQNYKIGETIGVMYGEKEESFVGKEGNTINFIKRTIYSILPPVSNPTAPQAKTPHWVAPSALQTPPKDDKFWEKQAYEKCCSLWATDTDHQVFLINLESGVYWDKFQAIKADGKKRFFDFGASVSASESVPLPIIDVSKEREDISVEDIPF